MFKLFLIVLYSFVLAAPISLATGVAFFVLSLFCLRLLGFSDIRWGLCNFIVVNLSFFSALFSFLFLFAYLCRSI